MATVSVVIPSFNAAPYITEAVNSAWKQSLPPVEVLVVDDGSTDDSRELARAAGARVIETPTNAGPATARNIGIRAASGELVAFLDADDIWEAGHLKACVALLDRYPRAALAFSLLSKFGALEHEPAEVVPSGTPVSMREALWAGNPLPQSGVVARREILLGAGGYRDGMRHAEDYELWLRLAQQHSFVSSGARLVRYRVHAGQYSRQLGLLIASAWAVRRELWDRIVAGLSPDERAHTASILQRAYEHDLRMAWHQRSREPFASVLGLHTLVPESDAIYQQWRRRARYRRPAWLAAAWLWDRLPDAVRRSVRARRMAESSTMNGN